jgi:hypothetical protein
LGSKIFKDSRDIKFTKFGQAEHFLWILQVAALNLEFEIQIPNLILTGLTGEADWAATWQTLTG